MTTRFLAADELNAPAAPFGKFTVGRDDRIIAFDAQAIRYWGAQAPESGSDFYGASFRCFGMNGRELSSAENPVARALAGLPSPAQDLIVEMPNGFREIWRLAVDPILAQGKVLGATASFRPRIPGPAARLGEDTLPTLIGYVGSDFRFRFANAAYRSWFGLAANDVVGKSLEEVLGSVAFAEIAPEMRMALDGSNREFERCVPLGNADRCLLLRLIPDAGQGGFVRGAALIGTDSRCQSAMTAVRSSRTA